ncbi:hypothetical protein [Psychrobacter sp. SZ93C1]|uniref:hypothetical protein n=1 Tax=Psychrobacter sp. SZ93C1 TaxID=2792058 RepID=UPI0018CDFD12|nr:hypothetical protein [Psychrobacter sp. SZ93C1]MBH0065370.1 hypothetical protein [Psychrobacter sp. SZ93C1]
MKKQYSAKNNNICKPAKTFLKLNNKRIVLFGSAIFSILFISACSPDSIFEDSMPMTEATANNADKTLQEAQEIEDNIRNSYARLASQRSDVCPKLIQEDVGSQVVERTAEVMVDDYCDYFLYPQEGQNISVKVNNRQIEALLIVPTLHNFANGDYQVSSYDKHVIRLAYNGADYKPENFIYDVAVTIAN